jgi:hypothetical protein
MIAIQIELKVDREQPDKVETTCMTIAIGYKEPAAIELKVAEELNAAFQTIANKYKASDVHMNIVVNKPDYSK